MVYATFASWRAGAMQKNENIPGQALPGRSSEGGVVAEEARGRAAGGGREDRDGAQRPAGDSVWSQCLVRLEAELSSESFNTWIRPLQARREQRGWVVLAPNRYVHERVVSEYLPRIHELVAALDPRVDAEMVDVQVGEVGSTPGKPLAAPRHPVGQADPASGAESHRLNPAYVFETFIEGNSNDVAKATAMQVAEKPGQSYNPLLLYGGVGLGKTHLMQAVGNAIRARSPSARVVYLHSEGFTSDMVAGLKTGTVQEVMQRYRSVDVLLIDDIHFFAKKLASQENFFHVFNAVLERRRPIVLTSDRYPSEIEGLEERLQSRFVGGLTQEVVPPELETRVAILQNKGDAAGVHIPKDVAFEIAEHIRSNIRELEGALGRVIAAAQHRKTAVTMGLMREALSGLFAIQGRRVTIDKIQRTVAEYCNIKLSEMLSGKRTRAVARPRQLAMALAKELTNHSLPEIGDHFGGRDHTTVLYACRRIAQLRASDRDVEEDYRNLSRKLSR